MILWWRCPSGQTSDARCAALELPARGLYWTLSDFADGSGSVPTGNLSLDEALRGAAPHDPPEARQAAWRQLVTAGLVELVDGAIKLHPPTRVGHSATVGASPAEPDPLTEDSPRSSASSTPRDLLDGWATRYKLRTPAQRRAWAGTKDAGMERVAHIPAEIVSEWVEAAGRKGGRFGRERSPYTRGPSRANAACAPTSERTQREGDVSSETGANTGANTTLLPHTPSSQKDTEGEGENALESAGGNRANASPLDGAASGANVGTENRPGTGTTTRAEVELMQQALVRSSGGKLDLISAPATVLRVFWSLLAEMKVDLAIAEVMGELAATPKRVWPYMHNPSRVTVSFLLGKVDNDGSRAAAPLVELVSQARTLLHERERAAALRATPKASQRPADARHPVSDDQAAESARILREGLKVRAAVSAPPTPAPPTHTASEASNDAE